MKVVLFDIDGTLLTCGGAGRRAVQTVLINHYGTAHLDYSFAGMTDPEIMRTSLELSGIEPSPERIAELLDAYLVELEREVETAEMFTVFDAAVQTAERARSEGFVVGLGTGNIEKGAYIKLRRAGISGFEFGGFASDHEDRAQLIAHGLRRGRSRLRDDAPGVIIGDTPRDVLAARANGLACIAVATGKFSLDELLRAKPDLAVESLDDARVMELLRS